MISFSKAVSKRSFYWLFNGVKVDWRQILSHVNHDYVDERTGDGKTGEFEGSKLCSCVFHNEKETKTTVSDQLKHGKAIEKQ